LSNIAAVRAFGREKYEAKRHLAKTEDWANKLKRSWDYQNMRIDFITSPLFVLTNALGLIIALMLGGSGHLNIAAIFVSFSYYLHLTGVIWRFNQIYRNIESAVTEAA